MEDQIIELEYQIKDLEKKIDKILTILKDNMGSIQTPLFMCIFSKKTVDFKYTIVYNSILVSKENYENI